MGEPAELTLRAVLLGSVLGAVLAASNVYGGLKVGFIEGGAVTAAVLGYALAAPLARRRPYSILENNVTQVVAASAATIPLSAGLVGPVAALAMLGQPLDPYRILTWGALVAVVGSLLAAPLRQRLVEQEKLPFPSATAVATVLVTMHRVGAAGLQGLALMCAAAVAGALAAIRDLLGWVPTVLVLPGTIRGVPSEALALGVAPSPLLVGAGMLMGLRFSASILAGAIIAWTGVAPALAARGGDASFGSFQQFLLWPGVALLLAGSLVPTLLDVPRFWSGAQELGSAVSRSRLGMLTCACLVACWLFAWLVLDLGPGGAGLVLALTAVAVRVCGRATGETDTAPASPLGALGQLLGGMIGRSSVQCPLVAGAAVTGAGAQGAQMLYAFKTGALLRARVHALIAAQLIGIMVGLATGFVAYAVVTRAHVLGSTTLPALLPLSWKATAEVIKGGASALPPHADLAVAIAVGAGIALALFERRPPRSWAPSPVAIGIGFLLPLSYVLPLALGAVAAHVAARHRPGLPVESIASGAMAGEAIVGVLTAAIAVLR